MCVFGLMHDVACVERGTRILSIHYYAFELQLANICQHTDDT